jgi:hypothetical protein
VCSFGRILAPSRGRGIEKFPSVRHSPCFHAAPLCGLHSRRGWRGRTGSRYVVIATGAMLAQVGHFQGKRYVITSDRFLELEELPRRIVFIRGGYISLEFAHVAARAGAEVTIPAYPPILQRVPRKSHQSPCVVVGSRETSVCQNSTIQALSSRCSLNVASTCFMQVIENGIPDGI